MKNLRFALLAFLPLLVSSQDAWELIYYHEFPFPTDGNICYVNPTEAWIVGNGFISKTIDGGISWELQYDNPDYYFVGVFFLDNQTGWVVGWSEVLKTTDCGANWTLQELPNPMGLDVESVYFLNQDTGWIAGSYKTIYYTEDGGDNWEVQHPYELGNHYFLYHIQFYDYNHGCAVGGTLTGQSHGIIMVTDNGGQNWTEVFPSGSEEFKKVYYSNIDTLWACDRNEKLYKSTDGGLTWEVFIDGLGSLSDMYFINNNHALTISSSHRLNITYDAWQTYNVLELGSFGMMRKFDFADDLNGLSIGNASVAKTTDGGESWARLNDKFTDIDFFDENVGVILPELPNTIPLRTTDGGYTWQPMNISSGGNLYDLHFISENIGFMITTAPELLKTTDAGINWQTIELPFDSAIYSDIQFNDENNGFLTTLDAKFIKTEDGGNTWNNYVFENAFLINELFFLDENNGWVGGIDGFCGITHDGGITWDETNLSSYNITEICFTDIDNGFAGCYSGDIYRTSDGGYNWELISDTLVNIGKIEFTDQNNGWIVTGQSVHRTTDGGNSWIKDFDVGFNMITSITDFKCMGLDKAWICTTDGRIYFRDGTTGLDKIHANSEQVVYYPNPVKDVLNVIMSEPYSSDYEIEIYSMGGKKELNRLIGNYEHNALSIQLNDLSAGVFIMRIKYGKEVMNFKFVKQ
jgi:photosystem II stability/assembly factor-like uncharacterized protein